MREVKPEKTRRSGKGHFRESYKLCTYSARMALSTIFSENLGYETGEMKKAVLLGEEWLKAVYCEDGMRELIDSSDIVVIFENIRCVVDAETEVVLGTIPFV